MKTMDDPKTALDKMIAKSAKEIAEAGVSTEAQMRDEKVPWLDNLPDLIAYIGGKLVNRPHDYGTTVHAMSMAALAAFYYVAKQIEPSGFQASMAEMDFMRRSRSIERFRIVVYDNLLYPQYCNEANIPGWRDEINKPETREWLREKAKKLLADNDAHPGVIEHWKNIVSDKQFAA